ncbi:hypothetical protein F5050DRAFT_1802640 [Lentinula boryana]|uniref:Uncharacterized protein n=1 Tax=Lentinula boryana TaxID=40481 RepID=A0ABQ8QU66_9AGAR|nr:hypothetical protein F5050DRAFT_1802640 [Lentinula boryana]
MGKNNFYVVTVGKDVGVFGKWLQVSQVRTGMNCEGYETKEEAMKAFDEAMANGFVKINGSFDRPYQSPRIYPPLDCPPYSCGPTSAVGPTSLPPTPTSVCKLPSPSISPSSHIPPSSPIRPTFPVQRSSKSPPSFPPSVFEHVSFGDIPGHAPNVTIRPRSPKKGKPETNLSRCQYCPKRNKKIQMTIEKDGCTYCGCNCAANNIKREQQKGHNTFPSMSERSSSAKGREPAHQQYEVNTISSESESDDDYDSSSSLVGQKAPITPRRVCTTMSVQSAHRSSTTRAKSVLRTLPPTADNISSSTSASRYGQKANKSPSRSKPNIAIDISDVESYPSDSDSDEDSSGPEDVTPLRTGLLLSPLTSPVFSNTALMDAAVNSIQLLRSTSSSPRTRNFACSSIVQNRADFSFGITPRVTMNHLVSRAGRSFLESSAGGDGDEGVALGLHQSHVPTTIYNEPADPRSPIPRNFIMAPGELNFPYFGRPSQNSGILGSPGKSTLFAN